MYLFIFYCHEWATRGSSERLVWRRLLFSRKRGDTGRETPPQAYTETGGRLLWRGRRATWRTPLLFTSHHSGARQWKSTREPSPNPSGWFLGRFQLIRELVSASNYRSLTPGAGIHTSGLQPYLPRRKQLQTLFYHLGLVCVITPKGTQQCPSRVRS